MTFQEAPFEIERLGLSPLQAMMLSAIGMKGPCGTAMIHAVIEDKASRSYSRRSISAMIGGLVRGGFVRMIPNTSGVFEWPTYTLTDKAKAFGKGEG